MAIGVLRDDLLGLPGVAHAELDGDPIAPAEVRVRLSLGADASAVAGEVGRILARHGLRPVTGNAHDAPAPVSEVEQSSVVDDPDVLLFSRVGLASIGIAEGSREIIVTATGTAGHASACASGPSIPAIDQAIVDVVAELAGRPTRPRVCSIDERILDGTSVVTVVIEERGERVAGSAVVRFGRAYAVGRAVWAALSSR